MPPAVIAAGIGAAGAIGGSVLSSSSTNRATRQASDAQTQTTAANNALAREIYNRNTGNFSPYMQSGQRANALLDNLLYGHQQQQQPQQGAPQGTGGQFQGQGGGGFPQNGFNGGEPYGGGIGNEGVYTGDEMQGGYGGMPGSPYGEQGGAPPGTITSGVQPQSGQDAWDAFRNSTNYNFRFGEGQNALNSGWAGMGALQSGAAMKDAIRYGQNFASNELGNWMNMLQGQQALGAGSASSLAGVGNDFLGSVTANNRMSADALSNAALLRGQSNNQMYGGIANALGGFASSFGNGGGGTGNQIASSFGRLWG